MPLAPGTRLGVYEIVTALGEGGMGTVYRARDPRLDRDVAIKVLRDEVHLDEDRRLRFIQEAKAISALKHPNIVTLHDVGREGETVYMVMELVDGKPLDELVAKGGMRPDDILRIGAQMADAVAEAHAAGIVHRDLKPANVMVQPSGRVKVLDFGLAKLVDAPRAASTRTEVTQTAAGVVVGTTPYMSPEQAEGKALDARSDIFSFGTLLYELCTGARAFRGETQASVMASVLRQDPPALADARPDLPPELARLVMRCLRKDPARRVQSMADLKVAFDELREDMASGRLAAPASARAPAARRPVWVIAAVSAAAALVALAGFLWNRRGASEGQAIVQPVPLTSFAGREMYPSFSPDGNQIAFAWTGERDDNSDIYVTLIGTAGTPLRLTTDPRFDSYPAWSPDGRFVAFVRRAPDSAVVDVMLVPALGGPERRLAQLSTRAFFEIPLTRVVWTRDSRFVFVSGGRSPQEPNHIHRVSVETGEIRRLVEAEAGVDGYTHLTVSPDGRTLAAHRIGGSEARTVELFPLSSAWDLAGPRSFAPITTRVTAMTWTADSRELVYRVGVTVPVPLHRVRIANGEPVAMPWVGPDASTPAIAPSRNRLVFARHARDANIWRLTLEASGTVSPAVQQLAPSSFREVFPQYSPDGKRLVFYSNRSGSVQIWTAEADGARAVQLTNMDHFATTGSPRWSPDGQRIVFDSDAGGSYHVYEVSADGGQPRALTSGTSNNFVASWSPDGRWIYFSSDRGARNDVWRVASGGGAPEQITTNGGEAPVVSADRAWLYYTKGSGTGGVWRRPLGGGEEARIVETTYRYNFALVADGIYYVPVPNKDGTAVVKHLDFSTGRTREVIAIDRPVDLGLAVSPDERYLLFTKLDYFGTDLMLVENFR